MTCGPCFSGHRSPGQIGPSSGDLIGRNLRWAGMKARRHRNPLWSVSQRNLLGLEKPFSYKRSAEGGGYVISVSSSFFFFFFSCCSCHWRKQPWFSRPLQNHGRALIELLSSPKLTPNRSSVRIASVQDDRVKSLDSHFSSQFGSPRREVPPGVRGRAPVRGSSSGRRRRATNQVS